MPQLTKISVYEDQVFRNHALFYELLVRKARHCAPQPFTGYAGHMRIAQLGGNLWNTLGYDFLKYEEPRGMN